MLVINDEKLNISKDIRANYLTHLKIDDAKRANPNLIFGQIEVIRKNLNEKYGDKINQKMSSIKKLDKHAKTIKNKH